MRCWCVSFGEVGTRLKEELGGGALEFRRSQEEDYKG